MSTEPVRPPATDPMKGFRGVCAGLLVLEAIVVLLGVLVVARFTQGALNPVAITVVLVLGLLMIVASGLQRRPWGLGFALVLQAGLLATGIFHVSLLAIGLLFVLVWGTVLWMRRDVARRMARGQLPSQQQ
ncbi:DUF4233 domain-containing protein [Pseudonocardia kujensis]|uniref:DUF4233 domain-containing protein n=1 Tax=Pseudonocardia kujensis TaxID=1128675 RepID=UPI001E5BCE44|nr:DUF4233 domain-containing protein [Pseudonocardia kujensis]MCE0764332.1 DUF4233 domain-containing protein [Pseudonocardia kujensis]